MPQPHALLSRTNSLHFALLLLCSFLWANSFLLIKVLAASLSPLALTAARGVIAGSALAVWLFFVQRQSLRPRGRELRDWMAMGVLQGMIPNVLTAYALTQITAGLMTMIQATTPLVLSVLAHFFFAHERMTPRRVAGLCVGFTGMALLIGPSALNGSVGLYGILASIATVLSYACASLYVFNIPNQQPARLSFGQQFFSGVPTLIAVLFITGPSAFAAVPENIWGLLFLGLLGTAFPLVLFMDVIKKAGPIMASMNGYMIPPWTALMGFLLLHETVSVRETIACLIVFAGIIIVSTAPRAAPSKKTLT